MTWWDCLLATTLTGGVGIVYAAGWIGVGIVAAVATAAWLITP